MLALAAGLKMYGRELDEVTTETYWRALADLTDDEFEAAAQAILRRETEFPPPAVILAVARPRTDPAAEAHRMLARAWSVGREVIPGNGCWWSGEKIRTELGRAAYEAFHACGGSAAFRDLDDPFHGPRIRREFAEAWQRVVAQEPAAALPAPGAAPQLPPPAEPLVLRVAAPEPQKALPPLTRPEPLPCSPEEQAKLDALAAKIREKREAMASPAGPQRITVPE